MPEYLSATAAAKHIGVHRTTVHRWIQEGRLKAIRVGERNYRISVVDIEAMSSDATPEPLPEAITNPPAAVRTAYADYIAAVVAAAPPLSKDQVDRLCALLHTAAAPADSLAS
jgi:excisionase family DNA binding protein